MDETELYRWIIFSLGLVSLTLSLLVIFAYYHFKRIETFAFRLVMLLCLQNGLNSVGYMIGIFNPGDYQWLCQLQGFLVEYSTISQFVISFWIAYTVLITTINKKANLESKAFWYCFTSFVLPVLLGFIPMVNGMYKQETPYFCWLSMEDQTYYIIFGVISCYGVFWMSVFFFIYCLFKIYSLIRLDPKTVTLYRNLMRFPLIMSLCWLPATANRLLVWILKDYSYSQWMFFLNISCDIVANILNALFFGLNQIVISEFRRYFFSKQSVEDFSGLDSKDNLSKVLNNPALKANYNGYPINDDQDNQNSII